MLASNSLAQAVSFDQIFTPVLATHHVVQVEISPDGQHVVWVESKVKNDDEFDRALYVTEVKPGTAPHMVGPGDPRAQYGMSTVTWSPDSKEIAYVVPAGSSDRSELRIAAAAGTGSRLLATFESQVTAPRWSADGSTIAVLATEEGEAGNEEARVVRIGKHYRRQRVALVDTGSGRVRLLTAPDLFVYEYDWSPDGRQMAVTAAYCCNAARGDGDDNWWTAGLYRLDVTTGRAVSLFQPRLQVASPRWSPDGRRIAFIGGLMSDFVAPGGDVFVISADAGEPHDLTPALAASVTWLGWSGPDRLLTAELVDGQAAITVIHATDGTQETLWQGAEGPYNGGLGFAMSIARDGRQSAAVKESFDRAPEVWAGPVGRWHQISSINRDVKSAIGKAESIHWTSDGMQIQGWLLYPKHYSPDRRYPLVVSVHGGPAGAIALHWPSSVDNAGVLSSLDYFVLYPNPRGSLGQGEAFTRGNVKDLGFGDYRDIEAGVKFVLAHLPVDPRRVGITGWSYGGYLAMWAITQTDMFSAAVAGPGVSDWQSYYGQTQIEKWMIPYFGASAYDDPLLYAKSSPIREVKNARTPTLFYVGKEDGVCPAAQSLQMWHGLKDLGVETELLLYANEGHGISRPANQSDLMARTVRWFDEHLR